jgi:hypothetical protein
MGSRWKVLYCSVKGNMVNAANWRIRDSTTSTAGFPFYGNELSSGQQQQMRCHLRAAAAPWTLDAKRVARRRNAETDFLDRADADAVGLAQSTIEGSGF